MGTNKVGIIMIVLSALMVVALKLTILSTSLVVGVGTMSLSFFPILSLLLFVLGVGTLFWGYVHSSVLTLIVLLIAFIFALYIWGQVLGFGALFGFRFVLPKVSL